MHKRARNHKLLVIVRKYDRTCLKSGVSHLVVKDVRKKVTYKSNKEFNVFLYEPQGKRLN